MSRFYQIIGLILLIVWFVTLFYILITNPKTDYLFIISLFLYSILLIKEGIQYLLLYYNHCITLQNDRLDIVSITNRKRVVLFTEIITFNYRPQKGWLILYTQTGKVKIHHHINGFWEIFEIIKENSSSIRKE